MGSLGGPQGRCHPCPGQRHKPTYAVTLATFSQLLRLRCLRNSSLQRPVCLLVNKASGWWRRYFQWVCAPWPLCLFGGGVPEKPDTSTPVQGPVDSAFPDLALHPSPSWAKHLYSTFRARGGPRSPSTWPCPCLLGLLQTEYHFDSSVQESGSCSRIQVGIIINEFRKRTSVYFTKIKSFYNSWPVASSSPPQYGVIGREG